MSSLSLPRLLLIAAGVLVLAVGGYIVWGNLGTAAEVDIDSAAGAAAGDQQQPEDDSTGADDPANLEGTWAVEPGDPSNISDGTFVGYRVREELANVGAVTAVGRTPVVTGTLTIEGTTVTSVSIEADLTQLASDNGFRDGQMARQGLETAQFPTATFVLTEPIDLPPTAVDGDSFEVDAVGEFTLHGVTRVVTWPLQAQRVGTSLVVVGALEIMMADHDITPPSAARVVSIEDRGVAELQLRFRPA